MTQFTLDSERILAAIATIQGTIPRLQQEVTSLQSQLVGPNHSWQGAAAISFQELMMRWRSTSDQLKMQLGQIGQALSFAAQQYSDIEYANQRLFL